MPLPSFSGKGVELMMLDDDTGRRTHLDIRSEDRPPDPGPPPEPPSDSVRELIVGYLRRYDWGPERIYTYIRERHNRHDVSRAVVRIVVGQEQARQRQ